jgi:hypothetical protein
MFVGYADNKHTRLQAAVCIVGLVFYTDICSQVSVVNSGPFMKKIHVKRLNPKIFRRWKNEL